MTQPESCESVEMCVMDPTMLLTKKGVTRSQSFDSPSTVVWAASEIYQLLTHILLTKHFAIKIYLCLS